MRSPFPSSRRPGRRSVLALAAALSTLAMLGVLGSMLIGTASVPQGFAEEHITASQTANGQRDLLVFHEAVVRIALGGSVADAALRRDLALQQLATLRSLAPHDRELPAIALEIEAIRLNGLVGRPAAIRAVDRRLTDVDRRFKARYDEGDLRFTGIITRAISARTDAQRVLAGLIGLSLLLLIVWSLRFRRRFSGDLASARDRARALERRYQSLVQSSGDLTLLIGGDGHVTYASPAALTVLGLPAEEVAGRPMLDLVADADRDAVGRALATASRLDPRQPRLAFRSCSDPGDDEPRWLEATVSDQVDDPDVAALVLTVRDVSDRHRLESELAHLAFHDPLTGLANRALLQERIAHAVARSLRAGGGVALLLLDLDDFKAINDSLGHGEGDRLLVAVATRLAASVRAGDTVARLGGDEFVVFLEDVPDAATAAAFAAELIRRIAEPVLIGEELMPVSASVGVRFVSGPDATEEGLLRDADLAMYAAKATGRGSCALFEPAMHDAAASSLSLRNDLHRAVDADELVLHYQPVVDLQRGVVVGFEALVRWQHPTLGLLGPDRFIPLAERSALITDVGTWVMREALHAAARLQAASGRDDLSMAVNLSPRQLESPDVIDLLAEALGASGLAPGRVVVELTEGVLMDKSDLVMDRLDAIRALGVRLALDDFGTGFSSLSYLERLPLDILKIDRSFVSALQQGTARTELVRTIIGLARVLGLRTVAEGVEDGAQLDSLRELGCDKAQGYLFSRPLPEDEALAALARPLPRPV